MNKKRSVNVLLLITILLFVVMYMAGIVIYGSKGFTHFQTFLNILINNAGLICVTCGMTCVMLTGGIDISVGSLVAMDCMIIAVGVTRWMWPAWALILFILAVGVLFGLVQGFCIAYLEIQPFIITMAGMFFARGMTAVLDVHQISVTDETFTKLSSLKITLPFGGYTNPKGMYVAPFIRISVIIALIVVLLTGFMLRKTRFGRSLYAVGGNQVSATLMGLDVKKTQLRAYHNAGSWHGNERHILRSHRRDASDRWCRDDHRFRLRRADQRNDLIPCQIQWTSARLMGEHRDSLSADALHRAAGCVCKDP